MTRDRTHLYISMAIFTAALVVVCYSLSWGATVRLAWDHDGAEGYRLYMAESGQPLAKVWQGPEKTTAVDLAENKTYQFAVTAYQGGMESEQSDILQYTVSPPQQVIIVPGRPAALRIEFQ